jgi:uncharacterized membrane protein
MNSRKGYFVYAVTLLCAAVFLLVGNRVASGGKRIFGQEMTGEMVRGYVLEVLQEEKESALGLSAETGKTILHFKARIAQGAHKGRTLNCVQEIDEMFALQIPKVREGDTVLLDIESNAEIPTAYLYDYVRTTPLLFLLFLFVGLVILFGRKKGFDTVVSLIITLLAIFVVLIPAVLAGRNIYYWSMLVCVFIVLSNLLLVQGVGLKSLTAVIGCVGGILSAGLIMLMVKDPMHITGLLEEESIYVFQLNPERPIDIRGTVFCMILVGSAGALMDVSMSISSALREMQTTSGEISRRQLLHSGFEIGKDMIGTMATTLVLAYIGGAMSSILLLIRYSANASMIINKEMIAVEILSSLSGSLSVVVAILVTSIICSLLYPVTQRRTGKK